MQVCDDSGSEKKEKNTLTCTLCVTVGYRLTLGVTNVIINVSTS